MRFILIAALLALGINAVFSFPYEENSIDKGELLKRLARVLIEDQEKVEEVKEEKIAHRSILDELEAELEKRKKETKPSASKTPKCGELQTLCGNKKKCVSVNKICNGRDDCGDSSDEKNCKNHKCTTGMKKCGASTQCVVDGHWCDGYSDCSNGADEKDCKGPKYSNQAWNEAFTCGPNDVTCDNTGECLFEMAFACDGTDDCGDGTDEGPKYCAKKKTRDLEESEKNKLIRALVKKLLRK